LDCLAVCETCLDGVSCSTCLTGKFLEAGLCTDCDPNCLDCIVTAVFCTSCDTAQSLYLDTSSNTCIACNSPKFKDNGVCVDACSYY
jgi:hypothetical protein